MAALSCLLAFCFSDCQYMIQVPDMLKREEGEEKEEKGAGDRDENRDRRQPFFSTHLPIHSSCSICFSASYFSTLSPVISEFSVCRSQAGRREGWEKKTQDALAHCTCSFDPPCCPWAVKENFWQAVSGVTGNLVGLSGDDERKFERHLEFFGGHFFFSSRMYLKPHLPPGLDRTRSVCVYWVCLHGHQTLMLNRIIWPPALLWCQSQ